MISSSQRLLLHNTQHTPVTDTYASGRIRNQIFIGKRPQTYAVDHAPHGTDQAALFLHNLDNRLEYNMLVATDPLICCKSLLFTRLLTAASNSTTFLCILSCTFAHVRAPQFSFHSGRVIRQLAICIIWAALNGSKFANRDSFHSIFFEKLTFA